MNVNFSPCSPFCPEQVWWHRFCAALNCAKLCPYTLYAVTCTVHLCVWPALNTGCNWFILVNIAVSLFSFHWLYVNCVIGVAIIPKYDFKWEQGSQTSKWIWGQRDHEQSLPLGDCLIGKTWKTLLGECPLLDFLMKWDNVRLGT